MKTAIEVYGELTATASPIVQSGRHESQADAFRHVPEDVRIKMQLGRAHSLIEIGCGPGLLLGALAPHVGSGIGIDHPAVIEKARRANAAAPNITFRAGEFPKDPVDADADRVLAYSVLQCLPDFDAVLAFMDAAIALLRPGGIAMFGDIPNWDKRAAFLATDAGKAFEAAWAKNVAAVDPFGAFAEAQQIGPFRNAHILTMIRRYRDAGLFAYILPQRPDLPWGISREDLLVQKF